MTIKSLFAHFKRRLPFAHDFTKWYIEALLRKGTPLLNSPLEKSVKHKHNIMMGLREHFSARPGNFAGRTHSPETIRKMRESAYRRNR